MRELKSKDGLGIWLCGGPVLATALIDEIDHVILKVNPFLMGRGRSLFASEIPRTSLRILRRRDYESGFALIHLRLER